MQSFIDTSTAFYGAGYAPMRRQFKLRSGPYSGRKVVVYQSAADMIKFSYSDAPYSQWSTPAVITENSADFPCSGWLDADGNLYVAYTVQTSLHLAFRKLTFVNGIWTVGDEVIIHADKNNSFPSIYKDANGRLHVCWTCLDPATTLSAIHYKRSNSDGAIWGAGPNDAGTALTPGSTSCHCQTVSAAPKAYCLYVDGGTKLAARLLLDGASVWEDEIALLSGSHISEPISAAMSETGGLLGVICESDYQLVYMEYDGANWSAPFTVCSQPHSAPLLMFNGAIPFVFYGIEIGAGQIELRCRCKNGTGFGAESLLAPETSRFATVYLYDHDGTPQFHNKTFEAGNNATADVLTSTSHALIASIDDALYLGADSPFANINLILSTPGVGGSVVWEYFAGPAWVAFVPATGEYHLDEATKLIRLWSDTAHVPLDWQKTKVELWSRFWVRARVTGAFATPPVGTQISPCTAIVHLNN